MRGDLLTKLYDGDAGIAGDEPNPGASARNRWAAPSMLCFSLKAVSSLSASSMSRSLYY